MAAEIGPQDSGLEVTSSLTAVGQSAPPEQAVAIDPRYDEVARLLRAEPWSFDFFQAVGLLERMRTGYGAVGRYGEPSREVVRFAAHPSLTFPPSSIHTLTAESSEWKMVVNFFGLTGPLGVLPRLYTVAIQERARVKDYTLRDFLDLFNHRATSLFYRAWTKYRVPVRYPGGMDDQVSQALLSLSGLGLPALQGRQEIADETFVWYSGLFGQQARSAVALEQIIEDYFGVPAEVEQFVGAWYRLDPELLCTFDETEEPSEQLGLGAVVGDEVYDQQARVRVRLGPLSLVEYKRLLPGGAAYRRLKQLTDFFSRRQIDFEAQLILRREEVPACELDPLEAEPVRLGWTTWMKSRPGFPRDPEDTVLFLQ